MEENLSIFSSARFFEKRPTGKGKDRSTIECAEWFCSNLYVGLKDGTVQHLSVSSSSSGERPERVREVGRRQMGRGGVVSQLKAVPVLNHLLVLWDGSVTTLNMFSLEPVPGLKKIQNVSVFYVSQPAAHSQPVFVSLFTASTKRRALSIHKVYVDRWESVGHVALPQDPVALAVYETCLCVATTDRYILHDFFAQSALDLFPHNHAKQNIIVSESGKGEFLLNAPGNLGMFVMKDGVSKRPPVQLPDGVLDAAVYFPYVLALQSQTLYIYSMLDQRLKQTISMQSAKALLATTESVLVVAEREIHWLSQTPLQDQIQGLLRCERADEALTLLDGVQALLPEDSYKNLHRSVICTSGWINFYSKAFLDAKELFIKSGLDPRDIISVYPAMTVISSDFKSQRPAVSNAKDLWRLSRDDWPTFQQYLSFLSHFLRETRGTVQSQICPQDVDTALLKLYLEQGEDENLEQLVSSPNDCVLHVCLPELERHKRFFTLGLLYQSQSQHFNAIQTWVRIVDGLCVDSRPGVFPHIVNTLCQLKQKSIIMKFIDWVLQRDQKVGVLIFTKRDSDDQSTFAPEEVLTFLGNYQAALTLYLEYLVHEMHSKQEKHHTLLATTYITHILQTAQRTPDSDENTEMREKLQQLLWHSSIYNTDTVQAKIKSSALHVEKAILLGRAGQHRAALQILVNQEKDQEAAESYCRRTSAGQGQEFTQQLFLCLLQVYLESNQSVTAVVDLLNNNAMTFNLVSVLQVLPTSWSLQLVRHFLCESLRGTVHERRMRGLEKNLAKVESLRHKHAWMEATQEKVKLDRSRVCHSCRRQLMGPEFLRRPTGEVVHTHCYTADKNL
ncbi:transforming growth factor-beta receptor-associated protein 1 isoform X1 [Pygocentrus nattereri]|uniref:CNH domain-containing protein n=1 Tax=Pygocentrus nattereri TaxID=42514 RepID=A0A3B4EEJ5_PYGNA|nr:transforming growth factor-beta receptor-associated protein 1 isoform X1 [Pygocentrus nattereri]XP_017579554.2 transforming growth factor-beta receptor-associated protein 1 isoform X1 [Pygocentrus nattereri]